MYRHRGNSTAGRHRVIREEPAIWFVARACKTFACVWGQSTGLIMPSGMCTLSRNGEEEECAIGWGFQTWTFHPLICCAGIDPLASPTDDCAPGYYSSGSGSCEGEMIGIVG